MRKLIWHAYMKAKYLFIINDSDPLKAMKLHAKYIIENGEADCGCHATLIWNI